jgi:hypothetical protein
MTLLHPQVDVGYKVAVAGEYQPGPNERRLCVREKISEVWPESPPDNKVHVFIPLPGGEYSIRLFARSLPLR